MMVQWNKALLREQGVTAAIIAWFSLGLPSLIWFGIIQFCPFVSWLQVEVVDWGLLGCVVTLYIVLWLIDRGTIK